LHPDLTIEIDPAAKAAATRAYEDALAAGLPEGAAETAMLAAYQDFEPPAPEPERTVEPDTGPRNPHRLPDDPPFPDWNSYTFAEQNLIEARSPGTADRVLQAKQWDDEAPARAAERARREAEAELAANPQAQIEAAVEDLRAQFRSRFWQLHPSERAQQARELGIDQRSFPTPDAPSNWAEKEQT
jgi:hypothetical protein